MLGGVLRTQRALTVSALVTPPALTGSPPWTLCRPLGRTFCSGPRSQSGLGLLRSLAPGPCACQGQPPACASRGCVCPGQPGSELHPPVLGRARGPVLVKPSVVSLLWPFQDWRWGCQQEAPPLRVLVSHLTSDPRPLTTCSPETLPEAPHPAWLPWGTLSVQGQFRGAGACGHPPLEGTVPLVSRSGKLFANSQAPVPVRALPVDFHIEGTTCSPFWFFLVPEGFTTWLQHPCCTEWPGHVSELVTGVPGTELPLRAGEQPVLLPVRPSSPLGVPVLCFRGVCVGSEGSP